MDTVADLVTMMFLMIALYAVCSMLTIPLDTGERLHPPKEDDERENQNE